MTTNKDFSGFFDYFDYEKMELMVWDGEISTTNLFKARFTNCTFLMDIDDGFQGKVLRGQNFDRIEVDGEKFSCLMEREAAGYPYYRIEFTSSLRDLLKRFPVDDSYPLILPINQPDKIKRGK